MPLWGWTNNCQHQIAANLQLLDAITLTCWCWNIYVGFLNIPEEIHPEARKLYIFSFLRNFHEKMINYIYTEGPSVLLSKFHTYESGIIFLTSLPQRPLKCTSQGNKSFLSSLQQIQNRSPWCLLARSTTLCPLPILLSLLWVTRAFMREKGTEGSLLEWQCVLHFSAASPKWQNLYNEIKVIRDHLRWGLSMLKAKSGGG